jgi:hypothetical protein
MKWSIEIFSFKKSEKWIEMILDFFAIQSGCLGDVDLLSEVGLTKSRNRCCPGYVI